METNPSGSQGSWWDYWGRATQLPRIGWYITNVCFTQLFLMELLVRWFVDGVLAVELWRKMEPGIILPVFVFFSPKW